MSPQVVAIHHRRLAVRRSHLMAETDIAGPKVVSMIRLMVGNKIRWSVDIADSVVGSAERYFHPVIVETRLLQVVFDNLLRFEVEGID